MKQLLIIAIALTSVNAFATRARVHALGHSDHLVDTYTVYTNPAHIFHLASDYVTLETGATGALAPTLENANAEGMIVRTMGDAKMGLSLGHESANASSWGLRRLSATPALRVNQQNPIELTYGMKFGDINFAGTLVYSNYNNKKAAVGALEKEATTALRLGATSGDWEAALALGLANSANIINGNKFTGSSDLNLFGAYTVDTMYFYANVATLVAKEESSAGVEQGKATFQGVRLGVVNSHKKDGNELFYSVALNQTESKYTGTPDTKATALQLPVVIGLEVEANSWLTLRGSVSQISLINDSKDETVTPATETAPGVDSTKVAAGAGLKFNKINVDGTLTAATSQTLNATSLLAQVGMSYWF